MTAARPRQNELVKGMKILRKTLVPVLFLAGLAALSAGCSAKAKKERLIKRADEFFQAGDYEKAKIEYANLMRIDQKNARAFERIGIIWLEEGAPMRAGPFLFRAKELAPDRVELKTKLAELYLAAGSLAAARNEALAALQAEPGNETALLLLADAARTPEEIAQAEEHAQRSPQKEGSKYHLAIATLAIRRGDMATIEAALQRSLAADPNSWMAHLALARLRFAQRNRQAANDEFKRAAELSPPRASPHLLFAEFKVQTGAREEAIAYLNEVVKKAPDYLPAWTMLAKLSAQKKLDEALPLLENVFRRDAQNFDARMLEAEIYRLKGNGKKSVDLLRSLEGAFPKVPAVKFQLARAALQSGDTAQAAGSLEQALLLAPNYNDAILLLAELNLRTGKPAPVVTAMEEFLKTNPNSERAQVFLADAYRAMDRPDDSAAILRQQIAANPRKPGPYLLLGVLLRQQNKMAEAREMLEKAMELETDKLVPLNQLVELDLLGGNAAGALSRVTAQKEKSPDSAAVLLLEAKVYATQREWAKAEATLEKVLELNANLPSAFELLVSVYIKAKRLPEAVERLESFIAKRPDHLGALMTLGLVFDEMKNFERARQTYEKLLAFKPDAVVAANNLAYLYSKHLNNPAKAHEWASKARSIEPDNPAIADTFGWILYQAGDYKQAAALLKEAADKMPDAPEVQYHWAMASYMMGDGESARKGFQTATRSEKDFPDKEDARRRLAALEGGTSGEEQASVSELEGLLTAQPNDPVTLARLGEAYEKQGDAGKAASTYEQAIQINPKLAAPTIKLAQLYAGPLQKKERALELAKKARELSPADPAVAEVLGAIAFEAGNFTWAHSLLQESARRAPDNAGVQHAFAWAAYSMGKLKEARQAMERSLQASAQGAKAEDAKAFLTLTAEAGAKESAAKETATQLLRSDGEYVPALMVQAADLAENGDSKQAEAIYQRVSKRFPDFAPAHKELARLYADNPATTAQAYDLATKARKTLTDDPELDRILGQLAYARKEYARAIQLLQESGKKNPLDAKSLYFLGLSQIEAKQKPAGRETLNQALSAGLKEPLAEEARQALSKLDLE